jgi:hypothetical protein
MKVNGQLHAPAALPTGKESLVPVRERERIRIKEKERNYGNFRLRKVDA